MKFKLALIGLILIGWGIFALYKGAEHNKIVKELQEEGINVQGSVMDKHQVRGYKGSGTDQLVVVFPFKGKKVANSIVVSPEVYQSTNINDRVELRHHPDDPAYVKMGGHRSIQLKGGDFWMALILIAGGAAMLVGSRKLADTSRSPKEHTAAPEEVKASGGSEERQRNSYFQLAPNAVRELDLMLQIPLKELVGQGLLELEGPEPDALPESIIGRAHLDIANPDKADECEGDVIIARISFELDHGTYVGVSTFHSNNLAEWMSGNEFAAGTKEGFDPLPFASAPTELKERFAKEKCWSPLRNMDDTRSYSEICLNGLVHEIRQKYLDVICSLIPEANDEGNAIEQFVILVSDLLDSYGLKIPPFYYRRPAAELLLRNTAVYDEEEEWWTEPDEWKPPLFKKSDPASVR